MTDWNERYRSDDLPWETGRVDVQLTSVITDFDIKPCRALDFGCGTGNNAIWLAEQGFKVTAVDLSSLAIEKARDKTDDVLNVKYLAADILQDTFTESPFDFIFDRGCFHSMPTLEDKKNCARRMHSVLDSDGLWLSLIGNADQDEREVGPPRLTATEITTVMEPFFEILILKSSKFDSNQDEPPRSWVCLLKKR